jgi:hypothetical protein
MIAVSEKTIPRIITFYREHPERELDFELVEVYYERSVDILRLFQTMMTQIFSDKSKEDIFLEEYSIIFNFMATLMLFTVNCNYSKEKE